MPQPVLKSQSMPSSGRVLILCLVALVITACASLPTYTLSPLPSGAVQLPFETLSLSEQGWRSNGPTIGVIATSGEVDQWQGQFSPSILVLLKAVDYSENVVILVNRGKSQCLPPEPSAIVQIVRQDRRIQLFANFPEYPLFGRSQPCPAILLYPHHIVVVPKQGMRQDTFAFDLLLGSRTLATLERWIP